MKKLIVLSGLIVAFILLYACDRDIVVDEKGSLNNEITQNINNNVEINYDSLEIIGNLHNECLEYLYNDILAIKNGEKNGSDNYEQYFRNMIYQFYLSNGYDIKSIADSLNFDLEKISTSWNNRNNWNISDTAKMLLNRLDININLYVESNLDKESFLDSCNTIENEAISILNENEKRLVGYGTSITKYSTVYWDSSAAKWHTLLKDSYCEMNIIKRYDKNPFDVILITKKQRKVLYADAQGAFVGGLYGAVGGGGIGCVFGVMFGGSGASLAKAVELETGCDILSWLGF